MLIVCAMIPLELAVAVIDLAFFLMACATMFTLLYLSPRVRKAEKEYFKKK